jgi:hypothetical protein
MPGRAQRGNSDASSWTQDEERETMPNPNPNDVFWNVCHKSSHLWKSPLTVGSSAAPGTSKSTALWPMTTEKQASDRRTTPPSRQDVHQRRRCTSSMVISPHPLQDTYMIVDPKWFASSACYYDWSWTHNANYEALQTQLCSLIWPMNKL